MKYDDEWPIMVVKPVLSKILLNTVRYEKEKLFWEWTLSGWWNCLTYPN